MTQEPPRQESEERETATSPEITPPDPNLLYEPDGIVKYLKQQHDFEIFLRAVNENRLKESSTKISELEEKNKNVGKKVTRLGKKVSNQIKELKREQGRLWEDRLRIIEIVSIFAAFLAFVTSQVVTIKDVAVTPREVSGTTLIFLGALVIFSLLVHLIFKNLSSADEEDGVSLKLGFLDGALFLMSVFLIYLGVQMVSDGNVKEQRLVKTEIKEVNIEAADYPASPSGQKRRPKWQIISNRCR